MELKFKSLAVLVFLLAAAVAATGQTAWYPAYEKDKPTPADIVLWDGEPHSIIVQILNLTPYEIKYNPSPQDFTVDGVKVAHLKDYVDANRYTNEGLMFAPVGVPNTIPGLPVEAFADLCNTDACTPAPPESVNGRLYSMVLAWDDYAGDINYSSVFWSAKDVPDRTGGYLDVPVGIYMSRISPSPPPISGIIKLVIGVVKVTVGTVKLATGTPSFKTIFEAFSLAKEFKDVDAEAATLANQKKGGEGYKMYVSSYTPPQANGSCYETPNDYKCYPSTRSTAGSDDGADAEWGPGIGGLANGSLVVTTHVLRGTSPGSSPNWGSLPIVMITLMRDIDFWEAQIEDTANHAPLNAIPGPGGVTVNVDPEVRAIFEQFRVIVQKHGVAASDAMKVAIASLNVDQRETLRSILRSFWSGQELSRPEINKQRQLLHSLVVKARLLLNEKEEG